MNMAPEYGPFNFSIMIFFFKCIIFLATYCDISAIFCPEKDELKGKLSILEIGLFVQYFEFLS